MSRDIRLLPEEFNPYHELPEIRLFLRWERLRLFYNATLGAEAVLLLIAFPPDGVLQPFYGGLALCIFLNVCFCVGPVLDGYARLMGLRHQAVTGVIFGMGTAFAAVSLFVFMGIRRFGAD